MLTREELINKAITDITFKIKQLIKNELSLTAINLTEAEMKSTVANILRFSLSQFVYKIIDEKDWSRFLAGFMYDTLCGIQQLQEEETNDATS